MFTAAILVATVILGPHFGLHRIVSPKPPTADIVLWGGCDLVHVGTGDSWAMMTVVEVTNASNFAVGLGTRVTYPDVKDDGTLSVNGIAEYAIFAPGDRKVWASEILHTHLTVRYRPCPEPNDLAGCGVILEQDVDAVCPPGDPRLTPVR